jgi:ribonuclease P protein component
MLILPIKSRQQILEGRNNAEKIIHGHSILLIITPTPAKNAEVSERYRATNFVRLLPVVTKKINKKAVVRNKLKRRIKEVFKNINDGLLKNKYDYQIIAKQHLIDTKFKDLAKDIEKCLKNASNFSEKIANKKPHFVK